MKKYVCFILAVSFILFCSACGGEPAERIADQAVSRYLDSAGQNHHPEEVLSNLEDWADEWGLEYRTDAAGNFWADLPASEGCEDYPGIILQSRMETGENKVREKDGCIIGDDAGPIGASGGIGTGILLAVVEGNVTHGPIRILLTNGVEGAAGLSADALKGDYLISLNGTSDEAVTYSCAGGFCSTFTKHCETAVVTKDEDVFTLQISGLQEEGAWNLAGLTAYFMEEFEGLGIGVRLIRGEYDQVQKSVGAEIAVPEGYSETTELVVEHRMTDLKKKYPEETNLTCTIRKEEEGSKDAIITRDSREIVQFIKHLSKDTDCIMESWKVDGGSMELGCSFHSGSGEAVKDCAEKTEKLAKKFGLTDVKDRNVPVWSGDPDNPLLTDVLEAYEKIGQTKAHAVRSEEGLECACFIEKAPRLKMVSMGVRIDDPDTAGETLHIHTVEPLVSVLLELLANMEE